MMKIKNILFVLSFIIMIKVNTIQGQDKPISKGYGSLNIGFGTPLGDFSSNAYASTGFNFNFAFAFPLFHSHFGISTKVDIVSNGFDIYSFMLSRKTDPNLNYDARSNGSYTNSTILIGAFYTIPLKKISFDYRIMFGILNSNMPDISIEASDNVGNESAIGLSTSSSSSFVTDLGIGIRYSFTPKLCGMLNMDYIISNASYSGTEQTYVQDSFGNWQYTSRPTIVNQQIELFNMTVGIGWQFGK